MAGCPKTTACSPSRMTLPGAEATTIAGSMHLSALNGLLGHRAHLLGSDQVVVLQGGLDHLIGGLALKVLAGTVPELVLEGGQSLGQLLLGVEFGALLGDELLLEGL